MLFQSVSQTQASPLKGLSVHQTIVDDPLRESVFDFSSAQNNRGYRHTITFDNNSVSNVSCARVAYFDSSLALFTAAFIPPIIPQKTKFARLGRCLESSFAPGIGERTPLLFGHAAQGHATTFRQVPLSPQDPPPAHLGGINMVSSWTEHCARFISFKFFLYNIRQGFRYE